MNPFQSLGTGLRVPLLAKEGALSFYLYTSLISRFKMAACGFIFSLSLAPILCAQQIYTGSDGMKVTVEDMSRIVSIGSAVTETIFALGAHENVIAVDESSIYPEETQDLPKVSFTRNLSAEGVLSMSPSMILASGSAGPETAVQQIRSTGVPFLKLTADETPEAAFKRVQMLGRILDKEAEADEIISRMEEDLDKARSFREKLEKKPVVLFIYARGPNTLMVAGKGTSAETMIELAGGINAFDSFDDYRPLTSEAVVAANPDIILMMNSGIESVGGVNGVLRSPGVSLTDAAKNDKIFAMDGNYLLGFGPRMGQAVLDLMDRLHPQLQL